MNYFAYGTLLDLDYMRRLCPSARPLGVMRLDGYELGFAKCADPSRAGCTLDAAPGGSLWGVHYELSEADMTKLDEASGVPQGNWARKRVTIHDLQGKPVETTTYVIPQASARHAPTAGHSRQDTPPPSPNLCRPDRARSRRCAARPCDRSSRRRRMAARCAD